ncbi:activated protein kinase kinase kinase 7 [Seminavis robusta]|uniref:Activated protein kinase kinase kinase 7 n=1 Tax=Seminavis robusta TaxID=568900 RepID=A0A9N8DHJ2_9STRA|nr:activated protein kinase kinase kinase 7 [Seminavis robusta]|eukprot:Sro91_g047760.1 activated protein kinase kinase kinase 7 (434) ;mRNA; r:71786-73087
MTDPTRRVVRTASNASKQFGKTITRQISGSSKRSNSKKIIFDAIRSTAQQAIEASPILSQSPENSVEYYHGYQVKKGKVILNGDFYDFSLVKSLQQENDNTDASSMFDSGEFTLTAFWRQCRYVAKRLSQKCSTEGDILQQATLRLVLEAKYLARLCHPNLVKARGMPCGEEAAHGCSGDFFLITERMTETLGARLERWRKNPTKSSICHDQCVPGSRDFRHKLGYAKSLIDALKYLHDQNLVVLNLKPENIGFLPDDTIQITDLSCCRELKPKDHRKSSTESEECSGHPFGFDIDIKGGESTQSQMARVQSNFLVLAASSGGIPRYLAPEAIVNGTYTKGADTYSWSLLMYEMLTLSKPYMGFKLPRQQLIKVCQNGQRPNLSLHKFPMELEGLLKMSWRKNHSKRPTMDDLIEVFPCLWNLQAMLVASPQA